MSDGMTDANYECRHGYARGGCQTCDAIKRAHANGERADKAEAALSAEQARGHALWQESRAFERAARDRADRAEAEVARLREAIRVKDEALLRERARHDFPDMSGRAANIRSGIDAALRAGHDGDAHTQPTGGPS